MVSLTHFYIHFLISSSKTTVGLNTTPLPILALLAISLLVNVVVGVALADTVITADSRKEIQKFGHNWLGTVLTQSKQRQKTKKRQTETKEKPQVEQKEEEEKKGQKYNFEDDPFWSSELFGKFQSASNNQDWFGSHQIPSYSSKF